MPTAEQAISVLGNEPDEARGKGMAEEGMRRGWRGKGLLISVSLLKSS